MRYLISLFLVLGSLFGFAKYEQHIGYESGLQSGRAEIQGKWDADKRKWENEALARENAERSALAKRIKDNADLEAKQRRDIQTLKASYETKMGNLRRDYAAAGRLRISKNLCAGFAAGTQAKSAGRVDEETATTWLLPESYSRNIKQLMLEADEIVESCRITQEYLEKTGQAP